MADNITEILNILKELQNFDTQIDGFKSKLELTPKKIEDINIEFEKYKTLTLTETENHKKSLVKQKELEVELKSNEQEIAKHQQELNQVKSNEAFKALQKEIDFAKKRTDEIENEILNQLDIIEVLKKTRAELEENIKVKQSETEKRISEIKDEESQLSDKIKETENKKNTLTEKVPSEILSKYEYIKTQRQGRAVVEAKKHPNGQISCGGCNMILISKTVGELAKKKSIVTCDNCQRMLYRQTENES